MSDILSLLSGGLIGGFIGAFLGGFAKFFWEHWLPGRLTWQREQKVQREKFLSQFRDPAIRAISDLQGRVFAILLNPKQAGNYTYVKGIGEGDYYILSTAFLIAQFFAWVEILRRKVAMLDYSELITKMESATRGFSHGIPGFQIFRMEQREIGERMLSGSSDSDQFCLGYSQFVDLANSEDAPRCLKLLKSRVQYLMENSISEMIRLVRIQHATIDLIEFIDPDVRWVPKDRRDRFDIKRQLDKMRDGDEISDADYKKLIKNATLSGVLIDKQPTAGLGTT
jgi:hypothetical protein